MKKLTLLALFLSVLISIASPGIRVVGRILFDGETYLAMDPQNPATYGGGMDGIRLAEQGLPHYRVTLMVVTPGVLQLSFRIR